MKRTLELAIRTIVTLTLPLLLCSLGDIEQARSYFKDGKYKDALIAALPLSKAGNPEAELYVGAIYQLELGVKRDSDKGLPLLKHSAGAGNVEAKYVLAHWLCYRDGTGVPKDQPSWSLSCAN